MECRDAQFYLRLRRQAADELGPEVAPELDRHLAACPHCAAEAGAVAAFDRAIGTAMRAVLVPAGLRERLVAKLSERRGAELRRKVYRYAGLAAALLLGVGLGYGAFRAARPAFDTYEIATKWEATDSADRAEEAVSAWLESHKLPRDLPAVKNFRFDYDLLMTYGMEQIHGRNVPVVVFRESPKEKIGAPPYDPKGFARVYILRTGDGFDLSGLQEIQTSRLMVEVVRDRPGFVYVIVHTGPDLARFSRGWGGLAG